MITATLPTTAMEAIKIKNISKQYISVHFFKMANIQFGVKGDESVMARYYVYIRVLISDGKFGVIECQKY